ncbi:adenosylhomocysteinase [Candidatus Gottesmanbacteria bacterium]|nr:adenosylhomocysteinase [Candidatus Gottesmanbacteria bacterium]
MKYDIKDIKLAEKGKMRMDWVEKNMPVLGLIKNRFAKEKPLKGIKISACLHITAETANLFLALKAGGAEVLGCASNPLSTQDDIAAALVKYEGLPIFAIKGEDSKTYYKHIQAALDFKPNITMDDGADLVSELHKNKDYKVDEKYHSSNHGTGQTGFLISSGKDKWEFIGSSEETTTGVIRLKAMERDKALKIPVMAVNDSDTKHMFDNRYGTGQSTLDGIIRATDVLLAGKKFVVCGYGWCGRGLAARARGMGSQVIVVEVDPTKALEAVMEGYEVMPLSEAVKSGDIFVTATGDKYVIDMDHMKAMKDGAMVANAGHFNVEIAIDKLEKTAKSKRQVREFVTEYTLEGMHNYHTTVRGSYTKNEKKIYILGEGRLINLVAATGHPAEVMDMSFANQALAAEWLIKNRTNLAAQVYRIPQEMDKEIARLKLEAMGVKIDTLTAEQKKYLSSWQEGT